MIQTLLFILLVNLTFPNYVKDIIISGNERTNVSLVKKLISHPKDTTFSLDIAKIDQRNIYTLECFEEVIIENRDSLYLVKLKEKKLVSYSPLIEKRDGLGWIGGINLNFNNIRGKTNRIYSELFNGAFKGYKIEYIDRKVGKSNYQLKINLYNNQSPSIEDNYKLKKNSIIINFINLKYNNKYHILIKHEKNKIISDLIGNSFNQYLIPSIEYYHNNLNNKFLQNVSLRYEYFISQSKTNNDNYKKIKIELKNKFILSDNIDSPTLDYKLKFHLTAGKKIPIYENIYLGDERNIRGYNPNPVLNHVNVREKLKFFNLILYSTEMNIPIYTNINFINKSYLFIFSDYGIGSNDYKNFDYKNKVNGYGFGLKLYNNKKNLIALSFGMNQYANKTIHIIFNQDIF